MAWSAETATDKNECLTSVATFAFSFPLNLHSPDNLVLSITTCKNKYQTMFSLESLNLKEAQIECCAFFLLIFISYGRVPLTGSGQEQAWASRAISESPAEPRDHL